MLVGSLTNMFKQVLCLNSLFNHKNVFMHKYKKYLKWFIKTHFSYYLLPQLLKMALLFRIFLQFWKS